MASNRNYAIIPYSPAASPAPNSNVGDLSRAVWDDFFRIAQSLSDLDKAVAVSTRNAETLSVAANPAWDRMLDEAVISSWQSPAGQIDPATGIWTCPQEGLYDFDFRIGVAPLNAPASKSYKVEMRMTIDYINPAKPNRVETFNSGGLDDTWLASSAGIMEPLVRGDTVLWDARALHSSKTGTVTCNFTMRSQRIGAAVGLIQ